MNVSTRKVWTSKLKPAGEIFLAKTRSDEELIARGDDNKYHTPGGTRQEKAFRQGSVGGVPKTKKSTV